MFTAGLASSAGATASKQRLLLVLHRLECWRYCGVCCGHCRLRPHCAVENDTQTKAHPSRDTCAMILRGTLFPQPHSIPFLPRPTTRTKIYTRGAAFPCIPITARPRQGCYDWPMRSNAEGRGHLAEGSSSVAKRCHHAPSFTVFKRWEARI